MDTRRVARVVGRFNNARELYAARAALMGGRVVACAEIEGATEYTVPDLQPSGGASMALGTSGKMPALSCITTVERAEEALGIMRDARKDSTEWTHVYGCIYAEVIEVNAVFAGFVRRAVSDAGQPAGDGGGKPTGAPDEKLGK